MLATVEAWRARGRVVETGDGPVWVLDLPGPSSGGGTPVLVLHGFPASSYDFASVVDAVAAGRRVVAFDFPGFGLSCKPADHGYSLFQQTDVALEVCRAVGLERAHLWAHDMGTSVATELLARRERGLCPLDVASVTLMNGSVHIEMSHLTLGQKVLRSPLGPAFARLSRRGTFLAQLRRTFVRPPDRQTLLAMWELLARDGGVARLPATIGYVTERSRFRRRWIGALTRCGLPVLVAWGRLDSVAVFPIAQRLARETPGAKLEAWDGVGHWPMIEAPSRVLATVQPFWEALG